MRRDNARGKAALEQIAKGRKTMTVSEAHRRVYAQLGIDFSGPTIASYLKGLGFERVREGVYERAA